jgi:hypothetical protein
MADDMRFGLLEKGHGANHDGIMADLVRLRKWKVINVKDWRLQQYLTIIVAQPDEIGGNRLHGLGKGGGPALAELSDEHFSERITRMHAAGHTMLLLLLFTHPLRCFALLCAALLCSA